MTRLPEESVAVRVFKGYRLMVAKAARGYDEDGRHRPQPILIYYTADSRLSKMMVESSPLLSRVLSAAGFDTTLDISPPSTAVAIMPSSACWGVPGEPPPLTPVSRPCSPWCGALCPLGGPAGTSDAGPVSAYGRCPLPSSWLL